MDFTYDLQRDFREIKNLFIEEELDDEDLAEGIEPIIHDVKVCLTNHALDRMYNTENRGIEWEEVESLLLIAGNSLLELKNKQTVTITTVDRTIAVFCSTHFQNGDLLLIVHTVVRVEMKKRGGYKKLFINNNDNAIIIAV